MAPDPALVPDTESISAHLAHITARWEELGEPVVLELVFLSAEDQAAVKDVRRYPPDRISEAVAHIAAMNRHRLNAYVVVNPVFASAPLAVGTRASREHIAGAFFHWADADDAHAADNIKGFVGPLFTFYVITGTQPCRRPHVYWELEEPTRNLEAWEKTQRAIAATLKTDRAVVDPPRIMRIGGTINWPKPKKLAKGYVAELTTIRIFDASERLPVSSARMQRAFTGAASAAASTEPPSEGRGGSLDRERAAMKALSGHGWHDAVIRLVGSYVRKGLSDAEIHSLTEPLTLAGYTLDDTRREVQRAIDGAWRKGWAPEERREYSDWTPPPGQNEGRWEPDHEPRPTPREPRNKPSLEWFDGVEPVLTGAYLVKGILDAGVMSVVYGPSNSGKTFFALDLVFHMAIGAPWRGRRVQQACVLYLAAEGGRGVSNRIAALRLSTGKCDVPLALRRGGLDLLRSNADLEAVYSLAREVQDKAPDLPLIVVVDTLSRVMAGGDENSATDMTALIRNLDTIREATRSHVMLVHHSGKDVARGARGHSSLRAATDTEIEIQSDKGVRMAMVTKQRDNPGGETFAFTLEGVRLGTDQDGDEVTSCVVKAADAEEARAALAQKKGLGGNQKIIADTFDQMLGEGLGRPNPGGVGFPQAGSLWAVSFDQLRTLSMAKMTATNLRGAFSEAWRALRDDRGLFCAASDLAWRVDKKVR